MPSRSERIASWGRRALRLAGKSSGYRKVCAGRHGRPHVRLPLRDVERKEGDVELVLNVTQGFWWGLVIGLALGIVWMMGVVLGLWE